MQAAKFEHHEIKAFMNHLASNPDARRRMLIACGLRIEDILEDEIGETPAALAEASSETICETRPDLLQVWLVGVQLKYPTTEEQMKMPTVKLIGILGKDKRFSVEYKNGMILKACIERLFKKVFGFHVWHAKCEAVVPGVDRAAIWSARDRYR
jgi:hypothetical protein